MQNQNGMLEVEGGKGKGILGAVIGGFIGILPMIILGIMGFISGWLGVLCVYTTYKGYCKMNGSHNEAFAKAVILIVSGLYIILTSVVFFLLYLASGADVSSFAGMIVIPFFALGIGYLLIKRKIWVYTNPGGEEERIANAQEMLGSNEEYNFYFPKKGATTTARVILIIVYICTIIASCFGMMAAISGTGYGMGITTVSVILFFVSMVCYIRSMFKINQAMQYMIVTNNYRTFQVQAHRLNQIRGYDFSNQSALVAMNLDRLGEKEIELLKSSIMAAIQKIDSGLLSENDPLCKAVKEFRNGHVVKDGTHQVKVSYMTRDGKTKTETLPKIYPSLNMFYTVNMDAGVYYANYWLMGILGSLSILLACTGVISGIVGIINSTQRAQEEREEANYDYTYDEDQVTDDLEELREANDELEEFLAQMEEYETGEVIEETVELTDENYQMFNEPVEGFDYVTIHYYKYFDGGFVDAYVPNGEVTYVEGGYGIESTLYGMKTYVTMKHGYNTAEEIVEERLGEIMASSSLEIYDPESIEVYYDPDWDIAITSYACSEGGQDKVVYLYADTRENGVYMYSEITYIFDELVEEADLLIKELSNVYAFDLPTVFE